MSPPSLPSTLISSHSPASVGLADPSSLHQLKELSDELLTRFTDKRTINLVVRSWSMDQLVAEINTAFATELAGYYPIDVRNIRIEKDPKRTVEPYTDGVHDGDVWSVEPYPLPKPKAPREPRHKPPGGGKAKGGGGQRQAGNRGAQGEPSRGGK